MIAFNNGLPLPRYDAFLLYDEAADMQPAIDVKKKLETEFNLKVIIIYLKVYFFLSYQSLLQYVQ